MCEVRLVPIAIVVCCELGGEMAFCYHLGRIYFRIALGARSPVHFQSRRIKKKLTKKQSLMLSVIKYQIFFRINILTLLSKTWWISIHLFSGLQFHFLLSGARKSKGKLDKVAWDKFYALGKKVWTAVWSVNLGWIICTPKECKLTIFKPYAEKFNISMPDHFPA